MITYTEVLFEEMTGVDGNLGVMTLNRPAVLNSLNQTMIQALHAQLKSWEHAPQIKGVVIRAAEGRAFCAGGDLRLTYDRIKAHDPSMANFFRDEYELNKTIFHYPKPYIALLDGITMGGGVGISIHGSHRIATDRLLFAMPETGIGFFPDVGGSYFLPRITCNMGIYLGLTGSRISSDDCVDLGLADYKVAREILPKLMEDLTHISFGSDAKTTVSSIIQAYQLPIQSSLRVHYDPLKACFAGNTVEDIVESLAHSQNTYCQNAHASLLKKSPTSLKVSLKALQVGKQLDFDACMQQEFRLVNRFLQEHDFAEGIRAVIIDKDYAPHWQPDSLNLITNKEIDRYFAPVIKELV